MGGHGRFLPPPVGPAVGGTRPSGRSNRCHYEYQCRDTHQDDADVLVPRMGIRWIQRRGLHRPPPGHPFHALRRLCLAPLGGHHLRHPGPQERPVGLALAGGLLVHTAALPPGLPRGHCRRHHRRQRRHLHEGPALRVGHAGGKPDRSGPHSLCAPRLAGQTGGRHCHRHDHAGVFCVRRQRGRIGCARHRIGGVLLRVAGSNHEKTPPWNRRIPGSLWGCLRGDVLCYQGGSRCHQGDLPCGQATTKFCFGQGQGPQQRHQHRRRWQHRQRQRHRQPRPLSVGHFVHSDQTRMVAGHYLCRGCQRQEERNERRQRQR
mmetsp:Transcript_4524/g.9849  ORF Transcript_4524/g.9849 Transcript_4524/m.9849 type:complete len:318 (-) Transcript_4524:1035-1988(-)